MATRRKYLKAGLAVGAGSVLFSSGLASAATADYETTTVPAGEVQNILVDGNQIHENKLYDVTADGAGVTFRLKDNATIRNVGIKGRNQTEKFVFRIGGGSNDITVDRVYTECFDPNLRQPGGVIATKNATGTLTIRGASIHGWGNNGLYASKSDVNLYVEDCYFTNNRTSNYRGGGNYHGNSRNHIFRNCTVVLDDLTDVALYPSGGDRTAGFRARWGDIEIRNCDVFLDPDAPDPVGGGTISDNSHCIRSESSAGNPSAQVYDSEINPHDRVHGDVNYVRNVGSSPSQQAPDYAPLSAEDAASGYTEDSGGSGSTTEPNLAISTGDATDVTDSGVMLSGELTTLDGVSSADVSFEYRQTEDTSWTATASQTLSSTGMYSIPIDGLVGDVEYEFRAVATASDSVSDTGSTNMFVTTVLNTLTIDGSNVGSQVAYEISVSDSITKGDRANPNDTVSGSTAIGQVNGGIDTYEFSGEITDVYVDEPIPILVNGTQIDLSQFTSDPVIDRFDVSEVGSKNPHANIIAEWDVSDDDGDLSNVTVDVIDQSGATLDSSTTSVSGDVAYDVDYFELRHVDGQTFEVRITAADATGTTASSSQTVQE